LQQDKGQTRGFTQMHANRQHGRSADAAATVGYVGTWLDATFSIGRIAGTLHRAAGMEGGGSRCCAHLLPAEGCARRAPQCLMARRVREC
jgi:hypothetical protein